MICLQEVPVSLDRKKRCKIDNPTVNQPSSTLSAGCQTSEMCPTPSNLSLPKEQKNALVQQRGSNAHSYTIPVAQQDPYTQENVTDEHPNLTTGENISHFISKEK